MAKEAVAAIVNDGQGNILLGKAKIKEGKYFSGRWHLPGETKDPGEKNEDALIRGILEETGINIIVIRFLTQYKSPTHAIVFWYECQATSFTLVPGSDLEEAKWVPMQKVLQAVDEKTLQVWPIEVRQYFGLVD